MSAFGPKRTPLVAPHMSAFRGKADIIQEKADTINVRYDFCFTESVSSNVATGSSPSFAGTLAVTSNVAS
jgi:hypothetical protein